MDSSPLLCISCKVGHADHHWRVARPFARLADLGIPAETCWLADEFPTVSPAGRIVVLQRTVVKGDSPNDVRAWIGRLKQAGALAVVFEIDDDEISGAAIDHRISGGGVTPLDTVIFERERQQLLWTLRACDAATVSTEPLADILRAHADIPVHVVPNAVDVDWFRSRLPERAPWADSLTIGWAGHRRPEADLEPMAVAWGRIARRYPEVRFVVAGWQADCFYREVEDVDRIIRVPWTDQIDAYPAGMQVSIGCCAVADTPFSRCKSPIKAWEYAVAGAAVVATPALYGECARLGYGTLAETADDWEWALAEMIESESIRAISAHYMRLHVADHHSLDTQLHRWAEVYRQIAASVGVTA